MKFLKYLLGGIAAVFILVFAGSLLLSKSYYLERSIEIQAPPENVFPLIGELCLPHPQPAQGWVGRW